jgi:transposase
MAANARKPDARRLDHRTLTELRRRAVQSVEAGQSPEVVAKAFGISRGAMYGWLALYNQGGWEALDAKKRGGRRPRVTGPMLKEVFDTVTQKNPLQLQFTFALWTSRMVGEFIRRTWGIKLSKATVCRLLGRLGLTPQRPLWRAYQQDPERVRRWLEEEFPQIRAEAKNAGARIFFADEAGVRSDHHAGTTWGKKGATPIVSTTGGRFRLNLISAVSAQGEFRFMVVSGRVNAGVFIEFLKRLIQNAAWPIYLIVDGHSAHKAKKVAQFVESVNDRLRLFFLPPYAPELNPDERVWNDLKNNTVGRQFIEDAAALKRAVVSFLRSLQRRPKRVMGYFNNATTRYAAV